MIWNILVGDAGPRPVIRKLLIGFLLAVVGCLGTLATQGLSKNIYNHFRPSPHRYLEGAYSGYWVWTDQNNRKSSTRDTVYFESIEDGKLIGRGVDPALGNYNFKGSVKTLRNRVRNARIIAAYLNDAGTAQPAQSGSFELEVAQSDPVILKGKWTGFLDGARISGTAVLTKEQE
ncbi:hypothetical protein HNP52_002039 [Sphingomonas kyeonggiensis]|uniref:Uncharacterized protein n=1 Tax=Sphingomonas kyeonggiensis TaxID=1268553 RepID=A0A7W7NR77_9SPHN|nr:hypothetical protein [Sphingomonas kyeonggiensis]MBB4838970.1 hypothetical protein [Sphingomonas kyeonggiensis]